MLYTKKRDLLRIIFPSIVLKITKQRICEVHFDSLSIDKNLV